MSAIADTGAVPLAELLADSGVEAVEAACQCTAPSVLLMHIPVTSTPMSYTWRYEEECARCGRRIKNL